MDDRKHYRPEGHTVGHTEGRTEGRTGRAKVRASSREQGGTDARADDPTRRAFLGATAHGLGATWLAVQLPLIEAAARHAFGAFERGQAFETLTPDEARELEAIAARILPSDDTPGAREAGVVHFIDRALGTFQSAALPAVRDGLEELQARVRRSDGDASTFSALPVSRQVEVLTEIEGGGFFATVRLLTIQGMFAHPDRGGNRDKLGWELLGFEDRFSWQPPFGHYDAEEADG